LTLFSCCVHGKDVARSRGRAPGKRVRGQSPLKLNLNAFLL